MTNWDKEATLILKAELTRRDINYRVLASRLAAIGVIDSEGAIANKISRGSFKMSFFLQCMKAIGVDAVSVAVHDRAYSAALHPDDREVNSFEVGGNV